MSSFAKDAKRQRVKMTRHIFDSSALLAILFEEQGGDIAETYLAGAILNTVNLTESLEKLSLRTDSFEESVTAIKNLVIDIENITFDHAVTAARIKPLTKPHGLSLGDRLCLASAMQHNCPVITADKTWKKLAKPLEIEIISVR